MKFDCFTGRGLRQSSNFELLKVDIFKMAADILKKLKRSMQMALEILSPQCFPKRRVPGIKNSIPGVKSSFSPYPPLSFPSSLLPVPKTLGMSEAML